MNDRRLNPRTPEQALGRALLYGTAGTLAAAATALLLPVAPLVQFALVPCLAGLSWQAGRLRRRLRRTERGLARERGFRFVDNRIPERGQKAERWPVEFPPFRLIRVEEKTVDGLGQRWQAVLATDDPQWCQVLAEQVSWLQREYPARWDLINAWWERRFLRPLLARWHGADREAGQRALRSAAEACRVELAMGVAIAGQEDLWTRQLGIGWEAAAFVDLCRRLHRLPRSAASPRRPFPRHSLPCRSHVFLGRGFTWDQRHCQRLNDLMARNLDETTIDPREQGDPRIYGVGDADAADVFVDEKQFNQMCGIFGSNGVGKTVYATVLMTQAIRNGHPVVVIDPKSDRDLLNAMVAEARACGRWHQFRYFSLAAPRQEATWSFLARYNPCADYTDVAELAGRIAAIVPQTSDPFWSNVAKGIIETCLTLCHWANWFLAHIGGSERESAAVPDLLVAMQWARHHPAATPVAAEAAVRRIRQLAADAQTAADPGEQEALDLLQLRSPHGIPLYSPLEWLPSLRLINERYIEGTVGLLAALLRIFHPHLYLDHDELADPRLPQLQDAERTCGGDDDMWSLYRLSQGHPLRDRHPGHGRWQAFYDHFVPPADTETARDRHGLFEMIPRHLDGLHTDATRDRQKFLEYAVTLQNAIKPFLGEKARIMCTHHSDLSWSRVVGEGQLVYCGLGSLIDPEGARSCAKLLIQDIASYIGRNYQYEQSAASEPRPLYLIADEVGSFVSDGFVDLLNKARGAGMRGIIIGQTTPDLAKQLGQEGASMIKGNLNTFIQLRSMLTSDAEEFSKRSGEVTIVEGTRNVGVTPSMGNTDEADISNFQVNEGRNFSRKSIGRVPQSAILNLPRGQAFIHAKGQVFLVAQGLLDHRHCAFPEEIGYQPGTLRLGPEPVSAAAGERSVNSPAGAPKGTSTTQHSEPAAASPPAVDADTSAQPPRRTAAEVATSGRALAALLATDTAGDDDEDDYSAL